MDFAGMDEDDQAACHCARTDCGSARASGGGAYSFGLELRSHVLARHSAKAGCKGSADFGCAHGDLLSPPNEPGPQYRLTYELRAQSVGGRFEMRVRREGIQNLSGVEGEKKVIWYTREDSNL